MAEQAPQLLDLDNEAVALSLSFLSVRDAARATAVCKLFALLVGEHHKDSTFLTSAVATSVAELQTAMAPKLASPPSFGVLFSNPDGDARSGSRRRRDIAALVRSMPPHARMIGGEVDTLLGTTPDNEMSVRRADGFAMSLGAFPEADITSFIGESPRTNESQAPLQQQLVEQGAFEPGLRILVLILCGRVAGFPLLLHALQQAHPEAAIIGGLATGGWLMHARAHDVRFIRSGVVGLGFKGNVPLHALVCRSKTGQRLKQAATQLTDANQRLLGGLLFTCTARDAADDARAFAAAFPRAPLIGLPAGGEIGPAAGGPPVRAGEVTQRGHAELQGFTAVFGLFAVPDRERAPVDIAYADVEGAYRESRETPAARMRATAALEAAACAGAEGSANESEEEDDDEGEEEEEEDDDDDDSFESWEGDDDEDVYDDGSDEDMEEDVAEQEEEEQAVEPEAID